MTPIARLITAAGRVAQELRHHRNNGTFPRALAEMIDELEQASLPEPTQLMVAAVKPPPTVWSKEPPAVGQRETKWWFKRLILSTGSEAWRTVIFGDTPHHFDLFPEPTTMHFEWAPCVPGATPDAELVEAACKVADALDRFEDGDPLPPLEFYRLRLALRAALSQGEVDDSVA